MSSKYLDRYSRVSPRYRLFYKSAVPSQGEPSYLITGDIPPGTGSKQPGLTIEKPFSQAIKVNCKTGKTKNC